MQLIRHNQFRKFAPNDGSGAGEGLGSRLDAFLAANPTGEAAPTPTPEAVPVAAAVTPVETPAITPDAEEHEEEEEEFPELGKPKEPVSEEFNEADFDAKTEEELKDLGDADKAARRFKELKTQLKELKKAASTKQPAAVSGELPAEIKTELETLRSQAAEVEGLRQRNQELLRVNDEVAVRESPEFIAAIVQPINDMNAVIAQMAEAAGVDVKALIDIVIEQDIVVQDKALEQVQSRLGPRMAGRLERLSDDYKAITHKSTKMLAEAPKTLATSRQQREAEAQAEKQLQVTAFKSATEESFKTYAARVPGFTDSSGALTDIAKATLAKTATIDPSTLAPSDLGYMAFCANAFPEARREIVRLQKENALLKTGKKPSGALGGGGGSPPVEDSEPPKGLVEAMAGKTFTFGG